ncbi:hypothetical protein ACFC1R_27145 [Kitasatospora sp. NPDC056138]|uniref:hypothetical protein n=1 Tax=Kitasatospora sp. NPDC056138 TaxID=3345724 RepID=UPI0035DB2E19
MSGGRPARVANSHGLGSWRASYRFSGQAWFIYAGCFVIPTAVFAANANPVAWRLAAVSAVLMLLCAGAGAQTRRRKAVHLFDEGIVLVGMWGQVKVVGRWSELTTWIKRTTQRYGTRHAYAVALRGRERFGFGEKQVLHGPELAAALAAAAAAGHRRALDETGSVTFGAESSSNPLGPLRITPEQIQLDRHNVKIPISDISRVWIATVPFRGRSFDILNVTTTTKPNDSTTMLSFHPADIIAAGALIASLTGTEVERGERTGT